MATVTAGSEIDKIRRHMAQIRRELHQDMKEVVSGAEVASDWRHYVRQYPWMAISAVAALGYFVVPKRRKVFIETSQAVGELRKMASVEAEKVQAKSRRKGWLRTGLGLATPLLIRAGQNYALHLVEGWLAQQAALAPTDQPATEGGDRTRAGPTDRTDGPRRT